ncbi:MAG: hypothetical protein WC967_13500 [Balneolaceae bacterium]
MVKVYIIEYKRGNKALIEEIQEFSKPLEAEIFINKFNLVSKLRASKANNNIDWFLLATRTPGSNVEFKEHVFEFRGVEL